MPWELWVNWTGNKSRLLASAERFPDLEEPLIQLLYDIVRDERSYVPKVRLVLKEGGFQTTLHLKLQRTKRLPILTEAKPEGNTDDEG